MNSQSQQWETGVQAFEHEALFKKLIVLATGVLIVVGGPLLVKPVSKLKGKGLNSNAWRSSYSERLMNPPPEPREGWWGTGLKPRQDPVLGIVSPLKQVPGVYNIDEWGVQHAQSSDHPDFRILILGGSVAFGAYASNLNRTYFRQLAFCLKGIAHRVAIDVYATGAWKSDNTLSALRLHGLVLHPDYVVLYDGLNDLMLLKEMSEDQRVQHYLENTRQERDLALAAGCKVILAPQPFLPDKKVKTGMEQLILIESYQPPSHLVAMYHKLRVGLQAMTIPGKVFYIDTSQAIVNRKKTIFADIWHFSDIGQAAVAMYLAHELDPLLSADEERRGIVRQTPYPAPYASYVPASIS